MSQPKEFFILLWRISFLFLLFGLSQPALHANVLGNNGRLASFHRIWEHHCLSALLLPWSGWWWWSGMRNANTELSGSMMWLCVQVVRWRGNIITEIQLPAGSAPAFLLVSLLFLCSLCLFSALSSFFLGKNKNKNRKCSFGVRKGKEKEDCGMGWGNGISESWMSQEVTHCQGLRRWVARVSGSILIFLVCVQWAFTSKWFPGWAGWSEVRHSDECAQSNKKVWFCIDPHFS